MIKIIATWDSECGFNISTLLSIKEKIEKGDGFINIYQSPSGNITMAWSDNWLSQADIENELEMLFKNLITQKDKKQP